MLCESTHRPVGENYILHRKYYDDRWHGERDGYMEVLITDYFKGITKDVSLVQIQIKTSFQNHRIGDVEWHDMNWCSQWEVRVYLNSTNTPQSCE